MASQVRVGVGKGRSGGLQTAYEDSTFTRSVAKRVDAVPQVPFGMLP